MAAATLPRHLALQGTSNFRDLGGYVGHGGRTVRWRALFRSDHLAHLTPQSLQQLHSMNVQHAVDFRGQSERAAAPYAWPQLTIHNPSVEPTVVQQAFTLLQAGGQLSRDETVALMQQTYRSFVHDYADAFSSLLQLLLEVPTPLVFHCTAGKDRTGWAAALVLHALGVSRNDIHRDYLLTNQYYQRPPEVAVRAAQRVPQEILDVLWRVQLDFIDSAFVMVDQHYGGMDTYLHDVLKLDTSAQRELQERYLAPAA